MSSFLAALLALLVPILAILIVRVRTRQRLRFPHTYLRSLRERPFREFLLRTFQLYSDVAFDLLLALLLALVLSGRAGPVPAAHGGLPGRLLVDDAGRAGLAAGAGPGEARARGARTRERYRLFVLGFDPRAGRARAASTWAGMGRSDLPRLRARVRQAAPRFFSADPRALERLFRRGYRRVIFLTDRPPRRRSPGLEVIDVGEAQGAVLLPVFGRLRPEGSRPSASGFCVTATTGPSAS